MGHAFVNLKVYLFNIFSFSLNVGVLKLYFVCFVKYLWVKVMKNCSLLQDPKCFRHSLVVSGLSHCQGGSRQPEPFTVQTI